MTFYFEMLSMSNFLDGSVVRFLRRQSRKSNKIHYYIDSTAGGILIREFFSLFYGIKFKKLEFELRHIRDKHGELVRSLVHRKDLFEIQENIVQNKEFIGFIHPAWEQDRIFDYIKKELVGGEISSGIASYPRALFLINVIAWHNEKTTGNSCIFFLNTRPWQSVLSKYSNEKNVRLMFLNGKSKPPIRERVINQIRKSPRLFIFAKNFNSNLAKPLVKKLSHNHNNIYIKGRGHLNFLNNGYNSDYFWVINSDFPFERVVCRYKNKGEKTVLENNGVCVTNGCTKYYPMKNGEKLHKISQIEDPQHYIEQEEIKCLLNRYRSDRNYWYSFFRFYKIKLFLTWYDNSAEHMAAADAIRDCDGIAAFWQTSLYGFENIECRTNIDIGFYFSNWCANLSRSIGSMNRYYIITGFLRDYAPPLLKDQAQQIRNRLNSSGARKIVSVMDENSTDDSRWHTGHELQRENYSYILEKVLEVPWLGVVFKPKVAKTLRRRLGPVNELLVAAEKTGRCIVYDNSGNNGMNVPPILPGLVADVCIHGHLIAGTAALECALEGVPTLLVDREGAPYSKLNILPKGLVVFKNWPETIDALMEHFQTSGGIPGFGDWSEHIEEFDPFRDGKAAYRMGTYLHWLIQGFDQGLDRETIMSDAAERYSSEWGSDKVLVSI